MKWSVLLATLLAASAASGMARAAAPAPDLDLAITYYSRVLTPEGVTRESRYQERMLRRPGHVWTERVLPKSIEEEPGGKQKVSLKQEHQHKEFNYVVLPRHVMLAKNKVSVEYIDAHEKQVIAVPKAEYGNVNFDGSWDNAFYLLAPELVAAMPLAKQPSGVPGARWHEVEKNGVFQRILWNGQKQIPLVIESGDKGNNFYRRVEVSVQAATRHDLPWMKLKAYGQKEYSDFLD
ncbi:hypothetical protein [Janthinobacterium agaricidamnosum]|uniref:Uncharacterized protein n=1 Tax=Janthinobacterium agaricidamnosum NBRC 102515 = DSM 9628 TaxID=1349767 RepID=W0V8S1_9BURK|nr:hypothetical protein [Janthinobacterium agaricidamnosum]CDG85229.1 putative uncharacterized protein [Janthinobacterium agaricidamnosum NBRC 102515 = DSM 9628]